MTPERFHMTPERLAEIRALGQELRYPSPELADSARRELLAYVDALETERDSRWQREDESYEVLAEDTVYDEATSLGEAVHKAGRAIDDIEAGELADCTIYIRRTTREIRQAQR